MRFLADMGVSTLTVKWLRNEGHDAVHLRELGLQRLPDEDILVKAREEGRIVLTMDLDLATCWQSAPTPCRASCYFG